MKMAAEEKTIISRVPAEAFLIRDESLLDINAPFYKWLRKNEFKHAWHKGHYDVCDWAFVNITHKLSAHRMPMRAGVSWRCLRRMDIRSKMTA